MGAESLLFGGLKTHFVYRQRISQLLITRSIAGACGSGNKQQRTGRLQDDFLLLLIFRRLIINDGHSSPWWCSNHPIQMHMHVILTLSSLPLFEWFDPAVGHCCWFLRKQSIYMSRFGRHHIPFPASSTLEKNVVLVSFPVRLHGYASFRVSLLLPAVALWMQYHE